MAKTSIGWCDYSWPIVNGCRRVSPGCGGADGGGCYAERLTATRLKYMPKYEGLSVMTESGPRWTGETRLWAPALTMPFTIKKPSKIFVADMGDLFYEHVPLPVIAAVFNVVTDPRGRHHVYQTLTKRAERMFHVMTDELPDYILEHYPDDSPLYASLLGWPPSNWWAGVSAEDQQRYDARRQWLERTPASKRFWSLEPLLGPIDLQFCECVTCCRGEHAGSCMVCAGWNDVNGQPCHVCQDGTCPRCDGQSEGKIHQVIVGGESGPGFRPMNIEWLESIKEQCRASGVKVWTKQDSALRPGQQGRIPDSLWSLKEFPA